MMKRTLLVMGSALMLASCGGHEKPQLQSMADTLSWALGENVALNLKQGQIVGLDYDLFMQAVRHTLDGREQPIDDETYNEAIRYIMMQSQLQQMSAEEQRQQDVDKAQEEYLQKLVATNKNVKQHPSGFYYEVLKKGKGKTPVYAESVRFDYRSFLMLTGEPFDQTYGRRPPIDHVIGNPMFSGLIEGLQLMNEGSIYRFYFPYQNAFGQNGSGDIPGYTPFIYEVELHALLD